MLVLHFGLYMVEHFILLIPRAGSTAVGHFSRYQSGQCATAHADIKNTAKYFTGDCRLDCLLKSSLLRR